MSRDRKKRSAAASSPPRRNHRRAAAAASPPPVSSPVRRSSRGATAAATSKSSRGVIQLDDSEDDEDDDEDEEETQELKGAVDTDVESEEGEEEQDAADSDAEDDDSQLQAEPPLETRTTRSRRGVAPAAAAAAAAVESTADEPEAELDDVMMHDAEPEQGEDEDEQAAAAAAAAAEAAGSPSKKKKNKRKKASRGMREAAALAGVDVQTFKKQRRSGGNRELDRLMGRDSKSVKLGWTKVEEAKPLTPEKRTLRSKKRDGSDDDGLYEDSDEEGEPRRSTRVAKPRQPPNISSHNEGRKSSAARGRNPYYAMGSGGGGGARHSSRHHRRRHRRHGGAGRTHYDSSSDSSNSSRSSSAGRNGRSSSSRRATAAGRHYSDDDSAAVQFDAGGRRRGRTGGNDEERAFAMHQAKQHERELNSIQPIAGASPAAVQTANGSSSSTSGVATAAAAAGGGGGGGHSSRSGGGAAGRDVLRADAAPLEIDPSVTWDSIGGLGRHVRALKEMVQLPLVYPEVFARFGAEPPRGILFHGPPGTGKTLTARALANACSNSSGQRVAFFMRKGADCLSKWVGEAERQLRLLFEQAKKHAPAVIFFDEIDGLAPVRSARQDQIHASIVSTLLALMDGLDSRGHVVVIGATNRPDAIDPALRRPGRFDRELAFALPDRDGRRSIIGIHTKAWTPQPPAALLDDIAERTAGYCGADLRALCAEATLRALRRRYPQIYEIEAKLVLDPTQVKPGRRDFAAAMRDLTPAAHRGVAASGRPLASHLAPLLEHVVAAAVQDVKTQLPAACSYAAGHVSDADDPYSSSDDEAPSTATAAAAATAAAGNHQDSSDSAYMNGSAAAAAQHTMDIDDLAPYHGGGSSTDASSLKSAAATTTTQQQQQQQQQESAEQLQEQRRKRRRGLKAADAWLIADSVHRPRLLLCGAVGQGQGQVAAAALHALEGLPSFSLDLGALLSDSALTPEAALVARVSEARRSSPCILYLPGAQRWWGPETASSPLLCSTLASLLNDLPESMPVLVLATIEGDESSWQQHAPPALRRALLGGVYEYSAAAAAADDSAGLYGEHAVSNGLYAAASPAAAAAVQHNGSARSPTGRVNPDVPRQCGHLQLEAPSAQCRKAFIAALVSHVTAVLRGGLAAAAAAATAAAAGSGSGSSAARPKRRHREVLPLAPAAPVRNAQEQSGDISAEVLEKEEHCLRELRSFLRHVLNELSKEKRYRYFAQPVDTEEYPDYREIIAEPMDLETMRCNVDDHVYMTLDSFVAHLTLIHANAVQFNPCDAKDQKGKSIESAANSMIEYAESITYDFKKMVGYDLFGRCDEVARNRRRRGHKTQPPERRRNPHLRHLRPNSSSSTAGQQRTATRLSATNLNGTSSGSGALALRDTARINYALEGIITDPYAEPAGSSSRSSRRSRATAGSDGKFLEIGSGNAVKEQGTVDVKRAQRKRRATATAAATAADSGADELDATSTIDMDDADNEGVTLSQQQQKQQQAGADSDAEQEAALDLDEQSQELSQEVQADDDDDDESGGMTNRKQLHQADHDAEVDAVQEVVVLDGSSSSDTEEQQQQGDNMEVDDAADAAADADREQQAQEAAAAAAAVAAEVAALQDDGMNTSDDEAAQRDTEALEEAIAGGLPGLRSDIKKATAAGTWSVEQLIGLRASLIRLTTATCAEAAAAAALSSDGSSSFAALPPSAAAGAVSIDYPRVVKTVLRALRRHVATVQPREPIADNVDGSIAAGLNSSAVQQ